MDSGTSFCTYIVYFIGKYRLSTILPNPLIHCRVAKLPSSPTTLLSTLLLLLRIHCCVRPCIQAGSFDTPQAVQGDLGDFTFHVVGTKVLKSEGDNLKFYIFLYPSPTLSLQIWLKIPQFHLFFSTYFLHPGSCSKFFDKMPKRD